MPVLGFLLLLAFLASGLFCVRCLLPRVKVTARVWLGLSLGLLLMMWLPALCAYALRFSLAAHAASLVLLAMADAICWFGRDRRDASGLNEEDWRFLIALAAVVLPLTVLGGYLQYTHVLRPDDAGNLCVGQSTYGDLAMHLSFVTGLKNAPFPPEYPIYPGHSLSYPYLMDTLSTSLYLFGWPLASSLTFPGTLMMALCYAGVMLLAREMTVSRKTAVLVALLFFLNGGLGFLYDFDLAAGFEPDGSLTVLSRLRNILEGYYKTPTNQPDPNNLRWSNLIADLLVPQRTLLGGYAMVIPCFYLLHLCFAPEKRGEAGRRPLILLGIWAGALPLIHTHSFLALGLASAGLLVYDLWHEGRWLRPSLKPAVALGVPVFAAAAVLAALGWKEGGALSAVFISSFTVLLLSAVTVGVSLSLAYRLPENRLFRRYLVYAGIAVLLAAPQLFLSTFRQSFQGSSHAFLTLQFNWVNNRGGNGMRDFYLWFYLKNIGLPFAALVLAAFEREPKWRRTLTAMAAIVLAAELIRFQPNEYDNNKLFYLAYLLGCMVIAEWARKLWHRLKGLRARPVIAVFTAVVLFLSAGLTLWRECVSDYQAFSGLQADVADWTLENTPEDARFISCPDTHLNPVASLAGRQTVCTGAGLWLYWHGFDTSETVSDIRAFYYDPAGRADVLEKYGVTHILLSGDERSRYGADDADFDPFYERVFENEEAVIYHVKGD